MAKKVRKKVDVDKYERTRRGRREHVTDHRRSQLVNAEGTPTMTALQRKVVRAEAPFVRPMGGAQRALDEIAKQWNEIVRTQLGPGYSGVLRDYDWKNPDSAPVVTGDLRDTTSFVVLGPDGQPLSHTDLLFENEIQSDLEDLDEEELVERDRTPPGDLDYGDYMRVWEEWEDAGYFDDAIQRARPRKPGVTFAWEEFTDSADSYPKIETPEGASAEMHLHVDKDLTGPGFDWRGDSSVAAFAPHGEGHADTLEAAMFAAEDWMNREADRIRGRVARVP